ncbi:MAG: LamG domain-containing protein, partial [Nanoarchaeota archaeon]|nr:LamG domain-containing protein [Nanoarchaeota archaeon]
TAIGTYQDDSTHSNQANADYIFLGHALQGSHDGPIDEVKVYHEALSADQIYQNYLAGLAGHNPQIIVSNETSVNDEWLCEVTPNDGYDDGTTKNSSAVTILPGPTAPTWVDYPVISPASPLTTQNLTCNYNVTDPNGDNITNITVWYKNNESITLLYMPFEGGSNSTYTKDYSGYGNDGMVIGSATWNRTGGQIGGAYEFSVGATYIEIPDSSSVGTSNSNFSIELWFYSKSWDHTAFPAFISKRVAFEDMDWEFYYSSSGSKIYLHMGESAADYVFSGAELDPSLNEWHHMVVTRNGSTYKLYYEGLLNYTDTSSQTWIDSENITIGTLQTGASNSFNGTIDEVKIYNYSLSPEQIQANYQSGLSGHNPTILVSNETSLNEEWICEVTPNDGYADGLTKNSTAVTIVSNSVPSVSSISISPTTANTTNALNCNATVTDTENSTLDVEYYWYNNSVLWLWGNKTGVSKDVNTVISTLGYLNTTFNETWNCTVRAYDGTDYSLEYASEAITIQNSVPTQDAPTIIPAYPKIASNLTCNWNNLVDADGHNVVNITNWYKDNESIYRLYMPFEGVNGNEANTAVDYSGYGNNGTVTGATWNRTGGIIGGDYVFNGNGNYINAGRDQSLDLTNTGTIILWLKSYRSYPSDDATTKYRGILAKTVNGSAGGQAAYLDWYGTNAARTLRARISNGATSNGFSISGFDFGTGWNNIAFTWNSTTLRLWINGVEETPASQTINAQVLDMDWHIGRAYNGGNWWHGEIDEIRIFNNSLTEQQILLYYEAESSSLSSYKIVSDETSLNDQWLCSVTPNDGYSDGLTKNSSAVTILSNNAPTWVDDPVITPASPLTTQNLTCNFNVTDVNGDAVTNITNWYKNNKSITVLYMPFEGNGNEENNATDYSGYGNNGTVVSATWNRTGGKIGGAYEFDGSGDYILLSHSQSLNLSGNTTAEFWIYVDGPQNNNWPRIIYKYPGYQINIRNSTESMGFTINTPGGDETIRCSSNSIAYNEWQHYAFIVRPTNAYCMINGEINVTDDIIISERNSSTNPFSIGAHNTGTWEFMGKIDELKIYDFALTPDQVMTNYQVGLSGLNSQVLVNNETTLGEEWLCSVTPNDGYSDGLTKNSSAVTILSNNAPEVTALSFNPTTANTSSNIECNATILDAENTTLTIEYWWYNNSVLAISGNKTEVANNTNTVITTLGSGNTTFNETWNCTVRAYDGEDYSDGYNSSKLTIQNSIPTHDAPTITPASPNVTSNLTCNWNNVVDGDGHNVVNITNWYKNNESITVLYMPFEGGSNSTYTKDYSGYGNNGTVIGATWNRTGGQIGGAYEFEENQRIVIPHSDVFNLTQELSIEFWEWHSSTQVAPSYPLILGILSQFKLYSQENNGRNYVALLTDEGTKYIYCATNSIENNTWQHYVFTVKSGDHSCYINGAENSSDTDTFTSINTSSDDLHIGNWPANNNDFIGRLDEIKIYNFTLTPEQVQANYQAGLSGHNSQILVSNETSTNDEWLCSVTPNDGYQDGITKNSTAVTITTTNSPPPKVTLTSPTNGNETIWANPPLFIWQNVTDADNDPVNFTINITSAVCPDVGVIGNLTSLNYTPTSELCFGEVYYWQVRAYDGTEYSEWSDKWNFTMEPVIILTLTQSEVSFGSMEVNGTNDTDTSPPSPMVVRNDGNVFANITWISINQSLFSSVGADTEYFQFKIDNDTTEANSFNWTESTTSWTNLSLIGSQNKTAVGFLNYSDAADTCEIDFRLWVPSQEPPGTKDVTVYIIGQDTT